MTSAETTSSTPASTPTAERQPTAPAEAPPEREQAPDIGPSSVHQPGAAPGQFILDGPAEMTVGARKGKKSGGKRK